MLNGLYDSPFGVTPIDCCGGVVPFDVRECAAEMVAEQSEVQEILIVESDCPNTSVPKIKPATFDAVGWAAVIDNTVASGKIKRIPVTGDLPTTESVKIAMAGGKNIEKTIYRKFTLNADIQDVSSVNYDFLNKMNDRDVFIWFVTAGGYIYGGEKGIKCTIQTEYELGRGAETIAVGKMNFKWKHAFFPPRAIYPLAS